MNPEEFLNSRLKACKGPQADLWRELQDLYTKKAWHLLTAKLKKCVEDANFVKQENMVEMRSRFIREFEHRISPLSLAEIILTMSHNISDKTEAVNFVESIKDVVKNNGEASTLLSVGVAELKMTVRDSSGRCPLIKEVKGHLDDAQNRLDGLTGVTPVHGPFYKALSAYLREIGDYAAYYRQALRYLGCVDVGKMPNDERTFHALCLALAAILGEDVYNFGELLAHPILASLKGTSHYYLVDLLYAFNAGDLKKFNYLRTEWSKQDDLRNQSPLLDRKIRLLALMESAFARKAQGRRLTFQEIAKMSDVPLDQVEFLAMKALSLGLVKGRIDEVDQSFDVTWVQPRVLDKKQIGNVSQRFEQWGEGVQKMSQLLFWQAEGILTQPAA